MLKVNDKNTKARCEICLTVSIVNFEQVNASWVRSTLRGKWQNLKSDTKKIRNREKDMKAWT